MADDPSPQRPGDGGDPPTGAGAGWTAIAYLLGGMTVWGFVGWLVDQWLHLGGIATAVGLVIGMAGGVYLVARHFGAR